MRPSPEQLARLRAAIDPWCPLPDASWERGATLFSLHRFERDDWLLHAGDVGRRFGHILTGVVRLVYTTEEGKQFNKSFSVEGEWYGSFRSSLLHEPSRFGIQALEAGQSLEVAFDDLARLFDDDPHWERLGRRAAEYQTLINEEREAEFLLDSATVRYERFRRQHAGLEERVAQYHIASYLGITDVALSRIRRRLQESESR